MAQVTRGPFGRLTPSEEHEHATSSEMAIDESKTRQKAGTPPNPLTRQPKNKKKEEDRRKDGDNTRKDFFPEKEADSTYKTYYKKENLRKIEERTMQASAPHTTKKQAASTNTAEDLSKTLEIQIQEAKQTMAKIEESMTSQEQPQYIHTGDAAATFESTRERAKT